MPTFSYTGRDSSGAAVSGSIDVGTREMAASMLLGRGVIPLSIESAAAAGKPANGFSLGAEKSLTLEELQIFSRQLQALLRGGLPILRALSSMQESATRPALARLFGDLAAAWTRGANCRRRWPATRTTSRRCTWRWCAWASRPDGWTTSCAASADWLEFERKTRERVKSALRYPSFVILAMAIALVVVNMFVIPRFATVYQTMRVDLPWMTQLLIGMSNFTLNWWPAILAACTAGIFGFRGWRRSIEGGLVWDRTGAPAADRRAHPAQRRARALRAAWRWGLSSGLPAAHAVQLVSQAVGNAFVAQRLERVRSGIERGESLLRSCTATGVFTPMVLQMMAVGEESGTLDEMLDHVADFYEQDVDYDLQRLSSAIEPILILVLGAIVLVLALGVFLPIWDLGKAALGHSG